MSSEYHTYDSSILPEPQAGVTVTARGTNGANSDTRGTDDLTSDGLQLTDQSGPHWLFL